jgi:FMN-dependent NADH-azoreductase
MTTLLRIDCSPLGDASFSRQLTAEFVQRWQQAHTDGKIITRDLSTTKLLPVSAQWIGSAFSPEASLSSPQREALAVSNELVAELQTADEYVFGVPTYNFSVPAALKLWIDQVVRVGKTFSYNNGTPSGLLHGKKATFLIASGGTPTAASNFVEPYLRAIFAFIGVRETVFINAGGTSKQMYGVDRETILEPARASILAQFQTA